jgi:hypothetical protein
VAAPEPSLLALSAAGIAGGLALLWRGFGGFRSAVSIGDTSTSRIASLAAGEVRVTGTVEPAEVTLVSPLQSRECVWYRAQVQPIGPDDGGDKFREERGVGFRVRDSSGTIRIFPRDGRVDAPDRYNERSGSYGEAPPGLDLRQGPTFGAGMAGDREAAIAALLTVRRPDPTAMIGGTTIGALQAGSGRRRYVEARLEPGDVVTVVGTALPFGHLEDADGADLLDHWDDPTVGLEDPTVAAEIAEARAAGRLLDQGEAWGNAAIPGFGIGRPVTDPELDPGVHEPVLATPTEAASIGRTFDLEPDLLVIAAGPGSALLVAAGSPGEAAARAQGRFMVGLLGALLAIGSAVAGAAMLSGAV